jgi:hypothetical protein
MRRALHRMLAKLQRNASGLLRPTQALTTKPIRVLLDNSIISGAEIAEYVTLEQLASWGNKQIPIRLAGYGKKVSHSAALQEEIDAIVTVGRLIREGKIAAYTYSELKAEALRRSATVKAFNSLAGCQISSCPSPIEQGKFRQTAKLTESLAKGGKKDKKQNMNVGDFNQIPYLEWLIHLDEHGIQFILLHHKEIGLTEFEVESFRQLDWFKFICSRFGSSENYPDAFHLWTAERNEIDIFLTLEKTLPNIVNQIRQSTSHKYQLKTSVLRPIGFLQSMGITDRDEVPIKAGQFYDFTSGCK